MANFINRLFGKSERVNEPSCQHPLPNFSQYEPEYIAYYIEQEQVVAALERADLLIIGGTSLAVYPAARLIGCYRGEPLVLINRDATPRDGAADLILREPIGQVLGSLRIS